MLLAVDVHYGAARVTTAAVGFTSWTDETSVLEHVVHHAGAPEAYEPGSFFKRELPHLVRVIEQVRAKHLVTTVVIDAHVWLEPGQPGLGAHLSTALGGLSVVGVAKTAYKGGIAIAVTRGESRAPLYITAAGLDPERAAELVRDMHGPFRLPTLLKRVDQLARANDVCDPSKVL
jgi:deoxyribonuclease V